MIAESLVSLLGGGILRLVPEAMGFFDKKNERKHELSMMDKQMAMKKLEAASAVQLAEVQHEAAVDTGMVQAMVEALQGQSKQTGIKWVDAVNSIVRPSITFALFGLYALVRVVAIVAAIKSDPTQWMAILKLSWTVDDMDLLSAVIGFWFANRSLMKGKP